MALCGRSGWTRIKAPGTICADPAADRTARSGRRGAVTGKNLSLHLPNFDPSGWRVLRCCRSVTRAPLHVMLPTAITHAWTPKMPRKSAPAGAATKPRTLAYCRVSTDAQAEDGQSLDVQQRQLEGWAMQRGQLDGVDVEAGVSGAVPFQDRPEGAKLWAGLQGRHPGRGQARSHVPLRIGLPRRGRGVQGARCVSLYLLDLNGGADDVSGNGIARLFLTIVSAFAEFERDRIGERIRATKRAQKAEQRVLRRLRAVRFRRRRKSPARAGERATSCDQADLHTPRQRSLAGAISADLGKRGIRLSHVAVGRVLSGTR